MLMASFCGTNDDYEICLVDGDCPGAGAGDCVDPASYETLITSDEIIQQGLRISGRTGPWAIAQGADDAGSSPRASVAFFEGDLEDDGSGNYFFCDSAANLTLDYSRAVSDSSAITPCASYTGEIVPQPNYCTYHATDCTSLSGCPEGAICHEQDANTLYGCKPASNHICYGAGWQGPL